MKSLTVSISLALALGLAAQKAAAQAPPPDGQALYGENCRACHGTAGVPAQRMTALYKNLRPFDAAFFAKRSEDSVVAVLQHGAGRDMKPFKDKLTPEQMRAIARYLKRLATPAPHAP